MIKRHHTSQSRSVHRPAARYRAKLRAMYSDFADYRAHTKRAVPLRVMPPW